MKEKIMEMLYDLLEKVSHHDSIVDKRNKKLAEIDKQQNKIDVPRKKIKGGWKFLGCLFVVIGWIILFVVFLVRKSKYKKHQAALATEMQVLRNELAQIDAELEIYDNEVLTPYINSIVPDQFPKRYCMNALAIEGMLCLLVDLRADTLKEAINLYEECMHRARLDAFICAGNEKMMAIVTSTALRLERSEPESVEEEAEEAFEVAEEAAVEEVEAVADEAVEEVAVETEAEETAAETVEEATGEAVAEGDVAEGVEETPAEEAIAEVVEETTAEEAVAETEPEQKTE